MKQNRQLPKTVKTDISIILFRRHSGTVRFSVFFQLIHEDSQAYTYLKFTSL